MEMEPLCTNGDVCDAAASGINPLEIDLVLKKVFQCLRTNAILTCRLVNRTWNSRALSILRSRECTISLDAANLKEYINFLKEFEFNPLSEEDCGFDPENLGNLQQTSLSFSVQFGVEDAKSAHETLDNVAELVNHFGPKCIHSFVFKCSVKQPDDLEQSLWIRVLKQIQAIASGLCELVICVHARPENFTSSVTLDSPSFPELKTLFFGQVHISPIILTQIVNSSPMLQNLTVTRKLFDSILDGQRISKMLSGITSLSNVRALSIDAVDYLDTALSPLPLDNMQQLKLRIENGVHDIRTDFISQFIRIKCPNLASLEFEFIPSSNSFTNTFPFNLPQLPRLTHLGYKVNWSHCIHQEPSFIKLDNLMTVHQKFPALQSVTTNLGSCVYVSTEFEEWQSYQLQEDQHVAWYNNPNISNINFSSVTTLNFIINYSIDFEFHPDHIGFPISLKESINQVHLLYPNIKKLHLDKQITAMPKEKCKLILRTLLEEIVGIRELVISNYDHDWLGELIAEEVSESGDTIPDFISKIQSLKILKIIACSRRNCNDSMYRLNLKILKHLPNLEQVHVEAQFLKEHNDEPFEAMQSRLEELKVLHPNCAVILM